MSNRGCEVRGEQEVSKAFDVLVVREVECNVAYCS